MQDADGLDAMVKACIAAHEAVMQHGSSELQAVSRILLFVLGEELARRAGPEDGGPTDGS